MQAVAEALVMTDCLPGLMLKRTDRHDEEMLRRRGIRRSCWAHPTIRCHASDNPWELDICTQPPWA